MISYRAVGISSSRSSRSHLTSLALKDLSRFVLSSSKLQKVLEGIESYHILINDNLYESYVK